MKGHGENCRVAPNISPAAANASFRASTARCRDETTNSVYIAYLDDLKAIAGRKVDVAG